MASGTATGKWGWRSSHEISHAARQNIHHVLYMRYAAETWRSFSFGEAINTEDLPVPLISVCKLFSVSPEHGGALSGFAVIGCLGIRLGPVSFHARDDNNGRHCRDDCWHHYSCALPHASIFTCCTDAPEVNEFFTLEFRAGSRRHIPSDMRGAQQVNQKTYTAHFSFLSSPPPPHGIRLL